METRVWCHQRVCKLERLPEHLIQEHQSLSASLDPSVRRCVLSARLEATAAAAVAAGAASAASAAGARGAAGAGSDSS